MYVCILPHNPSGKVHIGGDIHCRMGALNAYQALDPPWLNLGPLGTEGFEGETAEQDVRETWGWTLADVQLLSAAVMAHLPEGQ